MFFYFLNTKSAYGYNHLLHWLITLSWDIRIMRLREKAHWLHPFFVLDLDRGFEGFVFGINTVAHLMLLFAESPPCSVTFVSTILY